MNIATFLAGAVLIGLAASLAEYSGKSQSDNDMLSYMLAYLSVVLCFGGIVFLIIWYIEKS